VTSNAPGEHFKTFIYGTLLRRTGDVVFHDGLADAEKTRIVDPSTIEVELLPGQSFTNGDPLNADAVIAVIERMALSGASNNSRQGQLAAIKGKDADGNTIIADGALEKTGDLTFTIHLNQPIAGAFFDLLAQEETMPYVIPDVADDPATEDINELALAIQADPIGAGPYMLEPGSYRKNDSFRLIKNPDYIHADMINIPTIEYRHVTAEGVTNALNNGDVDWLESSITTAEQIQNPDYAYLEITNPDRWGWLWTACMSPADFADLIGTGQDPRLDDSGNPHPLTKVEVRQALNYGTDKRALIDTGLAGLDTANIEIMDQLFPNDSPFADPSLVDSYPYDPEKAKTMLADAGYADGLKLSIISTAGAVETTALILKEQWAKIGVDLELFASQNTVVDFYSARKVDFSGSVAGSSARFYTDKLTRNFQAPSVGATCQPDKESVGGNPRFNEVITELSGLSPSDPNTIPLWQEAARLVIEPAFGIFFSYPPSVEILNTAKIGVFATGGDFDGDLATITPTQVGVFYPDIEQIYIRK
jgi:peptide/nickel transport system substrate-binding protein